MNSIRDWLNSSQPYTLGAALYQTYGDDPKLKDMFAQGFSTYRQNRLRTCLKELLGKAEVVTVHVPEQAAPIVLTLQVHDMPETSVKPEEDPYREQWIAPYQRMNQLRHKLPLANSMEQRGTWALEILALERECKKIWDKRDYFLRTGSHMPEAPEQVKAPFVDRNELQRQLNNVRTYVTRYEKQCAKAKQDPATHKKLQQYISERDKIEKQLGKDISR